MKNVGKPCLVSKYQSNASTFKFKTKRKWILLRHLDKYQQLAYDTKKNWVRCRVEIASIVIGCISRRDGKSWKNAQSMIDIETGTKNIAKG